MAFELQPGRGPINKYGPLQEKGLIGGDESLHSKAKRRFGAKTMKEAVNPFDKQSKQKRQFKWEQTKKGNYNWKDSVRMMGKIGGYLVGGMLGVKKVRDDAYGL